MYRWLTITVGIVLLALVAFVAWSRPPNAHKAWTNVLDQCSNADQLKGMLYFGTANSIGPGSLWRRTSSGGYNLRWLLTDADTNPSNTLIDGQPNSCAGAQATHWLSSPRILLQTKLAPLRSQIGDSLDRANVVDVKVASWTIDYLHEGKFVALVNALPANNDYKLDLGRGDVLVMTKALRVSGFSATFHFKSNDGLRAKAMYNATAAGHLGADLNASWQGNTTLEVVSKGDFYIEGALSRYKEITGQGLVQSPSQYFTPEPVTSNISSVPVGLDDTIR